MKTYCVFQAVNNLGENRLIDRICARVEDGFTFYASIYDGADVFIIPNWSLQEDTPECFHNPRNYSKATREEIEWLRAHQNTYGWSFKDAIQSRCDSGNLGIYHGIVVTNYDESVHICHRFIIELRHVYE